MVEEVEIKTRDVRIAKEARVAPAGTNTLEGTLAAPLLLESAMVDPPAGAAPVKVTVPVEDPSPPTTLEGFKLSEARTGSGIGAGVTVSEADLVTPL